jgi:Amt family ammonium transporter
MIISGCVAERMPIISRMLLCALMILFLYPFIVHWCWNEDGWLYKLQYIDLAGCGVIHVIY